MISTNASQIAARLQERFSTLEEDVNEELEQATIEAERIANRLVPVDTGALKESIKADLTRYELRAEEPYAILVEEGTINTPPQPFLRPAALQAFADAARRLRGNTR